MEDKSKCNCACHDTEWNSARKHTPVEHDNKCCDEMNGYLSIPEVAGIEEFIRDVTQITPVPKHTGQIASRNIGMLRQWLNEDRKCKPMVTNEEIAYWLGLSTLTPKGEK